RHEHWKLILSLENGHRELYDLIKDPGEQHNLAAEQKPIADLLEEKLQQWLRDMATPLPLVANPDYDKNYETRYANSWWRKLRDKLAKTRYGTFLRETDL